MEVKIENSGVATEFFFFFEKFFQLLYFYLRDHWSGGSLILAIQYYRFRAKFSPSPSIFTVFNPYLVKNYFSTRQFPRSSIFFFIYTNMLKNKKEEARFISVIEPCIALGYFWTIFKRSNGLFCSVFLETLQIWTFKYHILIGWIRRQWVQ